MGDAVLSVRRATGVPERFYVWRAGVCAAIAVLGFAPTYWLQPAPGTFVGSPLVHLHAVTWGLLGVSLATAIGNQDRGSPDYRSLSLSDLAGSLQHVRKNYRGRFLVAKDLACVPVRTAVNR